MSFGTRVYNIIMSSLAVFALASCGGDKSKSAGVVFKVNPNKPVVISSDAPKGDNKVIKGPWFGFTITMTNTTTEPITLIAIETEVTGQTDSGSAVTKGVFSPSEYDVNTDNLKCEYVSYGTWAAGETRIIGLEHSLNACKVAGILFLSESNPKKTENPTFQYRVKVKPLGWFGPIDNATDRFDKTFSFSTQ